MAIKAVLFDLDGTLLPMDNDEFTRTYLRVISQAAVSWGYQPESMINALWKGTDHVIKNDGRESNETLFWRHFAQYIDNKTPQQVRADEPLFNTFYTTGFHQVRAATGPNPMARQMIEWAHLGGRRVILATNPIFPRIAILSRIGWVGLKEGDFDYITSYENSSYCKPNPLYYQEILDKNGLLPEECVMVGNNVDEDAIPSYSLGMEPLLITDCLINRKGKDIDMFRHGDFAAVAEMVKSIV